MPDSEETAREWEAYKLLLDLWKQENPIKTTKLQVLLAVNGGLLTVVQIEGGFIQANWPIFVLGAVASGIWLLSIGRTTLYQQLWKHKLEAISLKHADDPRFGVLAVEAVASKPGLFIRAVGGVSSKYYLLGAPIFFSLSWLAILLYALCHP
jgi:hypothetical protein